MRTGDVDTDPEAWLRGVAERLTHFERSDLIMLSSNADRDWWVDCFEAPDRVLAKLATLLEQAQPVDSGCWELPQATAARIRFRQRRLYAYQLVYWAGNALLPTTDEVVRHLCHNRRCIRPDHLRHGTQRDNKDDELTKLLDGPQSL